MKPARPQLWLSRPPSRGLRSGSPSMAPEGLLCGTDGYPHLIVDGRWSHAGEFVSPGNCLPLHRRMDWTGSAVST